MMILGDTKGLTVKAAQTKPHWGDSVPLRPRNLASLSSFPAPLRLLFPHRIKKKNPHHGVRRRISIPILFVPCHRSATAAESRSFDSLVTFLPEKKLLSLRVHTGVA